MNTEIDDAEEADGSRKRLFSRNQIDARLLALESLYGEVMELKRKLGEAKFSGSLEIDGGKKAKEGVGHIRTWLGKVTRELSNWTDEQQEQRAMPRIRRPKN